MDIFDKIGNVASETYKFTTEKTSKLAKETKIKMKINENKSKIDDIYEEIGKLIYQKHIREENINIEEDIEEFCKKIDVLSDDIEEKRREILNLRDKKQCSNCFKEIELENNFCPHCGAKQEQEPAKEVEVMEKEDVQENVEETNEDE